MLKAPLLLATFGLALNLALWSVPSLVAASAAAHLVPTPIQAASSAPGIADALAQLIGAEQEALQVAGMGLQQPTPQDLGPRADHAGARVESALSNYLSAARALLSH